MNFETIIGLEVHAQLLTESKMFCRCSVDYASTPPNTHVCPVCLGMPGVLPTINRQAVDYTIMTALAMNCTMSEYTKFDRKNYPYPDLMKGYQISQYDAPIGYHGWFSIEVNGEKKRIGITRVHLEEDVAKLLHRSSPEEEDYSLIDVNRSGVPLMEIVGEPDLRSPEEARQYLIKLRSILRYLGISTGNMEEGSFRCDANISIRPENSPNSIAKVEVKNMNSFKAVYLAMEYEARRQRQAVAEGKRLVQETRGWVEAKGKTISQRSKEYAHDYRYFPEPDLPPLVISQEWIEEIRAKLPELPEARRDRLISEYGLPLYAADLLTSSKEMADYFEDFRGANMGLSPKDISNWLLGPVSAIMNANSIDITEFFRRISPERLAGLLILQSQGAVNMPTAKSVIEEMFDSRKSAEEIINEQGLGQISDTRQIEEAVSQVINSNPHPVADFKAGKEQALKFLVGQIMKATKGRANPKLVNELIRKKLDEGLNPGEEE
ncbi:Asp-tRNA(Asn)/Glu-tRNA(Gln) amidotransferase subunit GatB [Chloroflexota bacterium]